MIQVFDPIYQFYLFVFNVVLKCLKSRRNLFDATPTFRLSIFNLSWIIYLSHLYIYGQSKNEELCFITIIFSSPSAFPSSIGKSKCCFPFTTQKSLLVRVAIKHCINCMKSNLLLLRAQNNIISYIVILFITYSVTSHAILHVYQGFDFYTKWISS